jgi:hypothetical protein
MYDEKTQGILGVNVRVAKFDESALTLLQINTYISTCM